MGISERFDTLVSWAELSENDERVFESHRSSVTRRIRSTLDTVNVVAIGSYSRGTAAANVSDVDLLAVLRTPAVSRAGALNSSDTVLANVRARLEERYTNTDVGKDGQAVVVGFADGKYPVDVVPAVYARAGVNNYPVYKIPDGEGDWMETSPGVHNKYIEEADRRSGYKLKQVAKLIKLWRTCRSQPLNSFHLELLLAHSNVCTGARGYAECVADALTLFCERDARALHDPMEISGNVRATNTEAQRLKLVASLRESAEHAQKALSNGRYGMLSEGYRQWDIVFNGYFPKQ